MERGAVHGRVRCGFLVSAYREGTARLGPPTHAMTIRGVPRSGCQQRVHLTRGSAAHGVSAQEPTRKSPHLTRPCSAPRACARSALGSSRIPLARDQECPRRYRGRAGRHGSRDSPSSPVRDRIPDLPNGHWSRVRVETSRAHAAVSVEVGGAWLRAAAPELIPRAQPIPASSGLFADAHFWARRYTSSRVSAGLVSQCHLNRPPRETRTSNLRDHRRPRTPPLHPP